MAKTMIRSLVKPVSAQSEFLTDAFLVVIGSLFVGAMSQVSVPLPFSPIPITGQTFAILLLGLTYGKSLTVYTLILYLVEGISGWPVFAGGKAGLAVLMGPTGGYLIGFIFGGMLIAELVARGFGKSPIKVFFASLTGNIVIYAFGVLGLMRFMDFPTALSLGVFPFLIGDVVKAILASASVPAAWKAIDKVRE
jgi:biotin transport system substrate-specific component